MKITKKELEELVIEEVAKTIEETSRIHAPSPAPSMPEEDEEEEAKKRRKKSQKVSHSVNHEDEVTGNVDNVGRIIEKLRKIIRTEVQNITNEAWKDERKKWRAPRDRGWRSRERHAGVRATERPKERKYSKISSVGAKLIDDKVNEFLKKMNDPEAGEWPETWIGGGRVYLGQDKGYRDRTEDEIAQMRKRFDDFREKAGRNPFKPEHIAVDLKQSGSSAWGYPDDDGDRYPSLSWRLDDIVDPLSKRFSLDSIDMKNILAKYLGGEMKVVES